MDQIAIVGLGYVGASIGYTLRLKHSKRYEVVGFDFDSKIQERADKTGALDRSHWSLSDAVRDADLIVVATPATAVREILEDISSFIEPGCVITDTTASATRLTEAAGQILDPSVGYISSYPLVSGVGIDEAAGDAFEGSEWAVAPAAAAPENAVRKTIRLIEDLGARPFFISVEEHDSYVAAATNLPIIVSNAMMLAAARSPSWREISKFATAQFGETSSASRINPATNRGAITSNPEMTIHWIDQMIVELAGFRAMMEGEDREDDDGALSEAMNQAWDARLRWENKIEPADLAPANIPSSGEMMLGMLIGHRTAERIRGSRFRDDY